MSAGLQSLDERSTGDCVRRDGGLTLPNNLTFDAAKTYPAVTGTLLAETDEYWYDVAARYRDFVESTAGSPDAMANKLTFLSQLSSHLEKVRNKRRGYILCGGWELMAHHADAGIGSHAGIQPQVGFLLLFTVTAEAVFCQQRF